MNNSPLDRVTVTRRSVLSGIVTAGAITFLAGCGFTGGSPGGNPSGKDAAKAANQSLRGVILADSVDSLDPHYVNNGNVIVPRGLLEGLVAVDAKGSGVIPAIAESWDISDDGMSYTFHIRDNATFSNGDKITAQSFVDCYQRLLAPGATGGGSTNGATTYKSSLGIVGASEFMSGTNTDFGTVGITAKDDSTLVIDLDVPNPAFLMGMTAVGMLLVHMPTIEKFPKDWQSPANWVGSGPYVLTQITPTSSLEMTAHDNYWGKDDVFITKATFRITTDANALLLAYRNNELDITETGVELITGDPELEKQWTSIGGYSVSFMQTMFSSHPASRDPRVRRAIAMALDRDSLAKVAVGSQPGTSLVPDSVPGWDKRLAIPFDVDKARSLLADAGYKNAEGMPTIQIITPVDLPLYQAVMAMLQENLGLKMIYNSMDFGQFSAIRYQPIEDPNMWGFNVNSFGGLPLYSNWVVDIWGPDVIPFFSLPPDQAAAYLAIQANKDMPAAEKQAQMNAITDQYATDEAKKFAKDARAAKVIPDDDKREAAFIDAAMQRQEMSYQIPLVWNGINFLQKPNVAGVNLNYSPSKYVLKGAYISE